MPRARDFPHWCQAPKQLLELDSHCGLLAAWSVLRFFGRRVPVLKLIKGCSHTKRHGVFAVALAAGLKGFGLDVAFYTNPDSQIGSFESRCYVRARKVGVIAQPAMNLSTLLKERRRGKIPIVLFNTDSDVGHFSPLLGRRRGNLLLPLAENGEMNVDEFLSRWSEEGILRQCIVVAGMHQQILAKH